MKYYTINNSTNEKEIGKIYPQCKGLPTKLGYTYKWLDEPNSMTKLSNHCYPDFNPELLFELDKKAILTDVVSPSNIKAKGFLVNGKTKEILSHMSLMDHKFYEATVFHKGLEIQFYWVHFNHDENKYLRLIDFDASKFIVTNLAFQKTGEIQLRSVEDYWNKRIPMTHIRSEKMILKERPEFDLFYIPYVHSDFFASEKLVNELTALEITGLSIKEQNLL